jgi:hypothetical protein
VRKLSIPTVLDRLIQQAVMQVLQRQWDSTFSDHSYGFRPGRSAHQPGGPGTAIHCRRLRLDRGRRLEQLWTRQEGLWRNVWLLFGAGVLLFLALLIFSLRLWWMLRSCQCVT